MTSVSELLSSNFKHLVVFSDGPLFPPDHELSLRTSGLEKPKRKRGRPPKQVTEEQLETEVKIEPETTLQEEENEIDSDGRKRRKIKAPSRYQGIVQVRYPLNLF